MLNTVALLHESIVEEAALTWFGELAYAQLQTYIAEIPALMHCNELLVVSDGVQARIGSLTANKEQYSVGSILEPTVISTHKEVCP